MTGRKQDTTSAIAQAVIDVLLSARDSAASHAKDWGHDAQEQFAEVRGETGRRASAAWDALAGRTQSIDAWPAIGIGLVGIAVGWIACDIYRRRQQIADTVGENPDDLKGSVDRRVANAQATPGGPIDKAKTALADPLP
jgi:hypothetical protein